MSLENKINNIIKQNESIYNSLLNKNIQFERTIILDTDDLESKFNKLNLENTQLKEVVKKNKPQPEPKKEKIISHVEPVIEKVEKKQYITLTDMEELKRAFCNMEYEKFENILDQYNFKFYYATYKYSNDKNGCPEFIAKNLLKGFVRNFDEFNKYLFVCFRCKKLNEETNTYFYYSYWIVNSTESLENIIDDLYDDFNFNSILGNELKMMFRKNNEDNILDEQYLH